MVPLNMMAAISTKRDHTILKGIFIPLGHTPQHVAVLGAIRQRMLRGVLTAKVGDRVGAVMRTRFPVALVVEVKG